ncbi:cytochrome c biogenesis CcdA family protein [Sporosalibacterium faouarense]|uniref:cytochrome c biogenesis CcdA family protein n=1 Tax=Sporosalibacterium faouarense TaxID=516123 RepID=UPI00141D3E67|nr:cytochrome c biogenesis protein CcdA [Sporosalibacterium faouarense]MTI48838.1 cytochrome c biogenesis protein CcdA [Bacillota bacterium]
MGDVSIPIALVAGFLSFFSPCVLPLIPGYITYITGTSMEEELADKKLFALRRTIGFIVGFTLIFMIMGVSASFVGKLFNAYKYYFIKISGILIVVFGLNMMGILKIGLLNREKRFKLPKITSWFSSILMGMAFAAGWTPCIGAVLGSILLYAGTTATVAKGVYLLFAYSLGLAVPFILTALLINKFSKFLVKSERIMPIIMKVSGGLIIILGMLIFFDKMYIIANWFI